MWRWCALAVLVAGSLACGNTTNSAGDTAGDASAGAAPVSSAVSSAPAVTEGAVAVVPAALRFSSPLVGGGSIDGASLAGRPAVLWFWAPT